MSLAPGTRLGPHEIIAPIGAGGMGEVYRARDTRLGRDVAIKVLPSHLSANSEVRARFEREARAISQLNHPHICTLHDIGHQDDIDYLVMEYLEGETLLHRLGKGPLPVAEVLRYGIEIAGALDVAHRSGIVHRDLKPGNVMLTKGGAKLMDFGLARATGLSSPVSGRGATMSAMTQSPTMAAPLTAEGTILGTFQYMAPEQLEGREVDARTDLWALGCVLYEMATGKRPFEGTSQASLISTIMKDEPRPMSDLQPLAPPALQRIVTRCLAKDPDDRFQSARDLAFDLEWMAGAGAAPSAIVGGGDASAGPGRKSRERLAWLVAGVMALAALVAVVVVLSGNWPRERPKEKRPLRLSIVHTEGSEVGAPAISPDGRRVAYRARRADGMPLLWVRDLDTFEARPLAGTEDAYLPFWSPDSRNLAFFAAGALKRIPADGGPVQVVADSPWGNGGAWAPDDTIVFSEGRELLRVGAAGGAANPATSLPGKDWAHLWPSFLPDGRRFLFTAKLWTRSAEASEQGIYLGSLDDPEVRRLLPDLSSAVYAPPGYIVFVRDGILTAAPFDLETGRLSGEPRPLGEAAAVDMVYFAAVSAAADGTLAVRPPPACARALVGMCDAELRFVDRAGRVMSTGALQSYAYRMALAPDGRRVAAQITDRRSGTNDLWLVDVISGTRSRLTTTHGWAGFPLWSSDGARLVYAYQPPGQLDDVYVKDLRTGQVTPVIESPEVLEHPLAWSHDGAHLLVSRRENQTLGLFAWSFTSRKLTPFVTPIPYQEAAVFSPDDRYVAFSSIESGRVEVYVTTFPERRQTWPLTTEGGSVLSWRADGREILVATLSGHIAAYPVSTEGGFTAGQPTILIRDVGIAASFSSATPDHSRILIRVSPDAAKDKGEIRLLFNWAEALKQGRPGGESP